MVITDIKEGKKNKNRVNIYADEEFVCALYLETAVKYGIKKGLEVSRDDIVSMMQEDEFRYAFDTALKYISYKMRSEKEVRDKLKKAEVSAEAEEHAISKMKELGYIDDAGYAEMYISELSASFGKNAIEQKLFMKGISKEIIRELLAGIEQRELAVSWAEKLFKKYFGDDKYKVKQKVFRAMMTRGFDFDDIKYAVARVSEQGDDYEEC